MQNNWTPIVIGGVTGLIGLYVGITTRLGPRNPQDLSYVLKWYAKIGGWIVGVFGLLGVALELMERF